MNVLGFAPLYPTYPTDLAPIYSGYHNIVVVVFFRKSAISAIAPWDLLDATKVVGIAVLN